MLVLLLWAGACLPGDDLGDPDSAPTSGAYPRVQVTIGMHVIQAEVADTKARKTRGLSGRKELREGEGMLFPYAQANRPGFWMYDMHFDIDIV